MEDILDSIESSQHCQRNWDLDKNIDPEHIKIFEEVVKTVPSKQNIAYYKVHFITNRSTIEEIFKWTITGRDRETFNPQVLANLLVVFEDYYSVTKNIPAIEENSSSEKYGNYSIHIDRQQAIGIASGVLSFTANYLGYKTGFCRCFKTEDISPIIGTISNISLLLGIGIPKSGLSHTVHHNGRSYSRSIKKANIPVEMLP